MPGNRDRTVIRRLDDETGQTAALPMQEEKRRLSGQINADKPRILRDTRPEA